MALIRGDFTTVYEVRSQYLKSTETVDDSMLLNMIRGVSQDITNAASPKHFFPRIATYYFSVPEDRELNFCGEWLLSATTLTNGNGDVIAASDYNLLPRNHAPYYALVTKEMSLITWETDSSGNSEYVISLAGTWCFARDGLADWVLPGATLAAAITTTSATTFTCTTGIIRAGMLLKIDSEFLYVTAVTTGASDTVTVERGVNGSTAATHLISTAIYRWTPGEDLEDLARRASLARYKAKTNPIGETITVDGMSFSTPKDITAYIANTVKQLGLTSLV